MAAREGGEGGGWRHVASYLIGAGLVLSAAAGMAYRGRTDWLFSPGPVARLHRSVERQCLACHQPFAGVSATKCLNCHQRVRDDIQADRAGVHRGMRHCQSCHPDHRGRQDPMMRWDEGAFDHNDTVFELRGAHLDTACERCHQERWRRDTPSACAACHRDPHGDQLADECMQCHSQSVWSPSTFRHRVRSPGFPMGYRHSQLKCEQCHSGGRYRPTPSRCLDCHPPQRVPHDSMRPYACLSCHNEMNWSDLHFDHARVKVDLPGHFARLACASCHGRSRWSGRPRTCIGCHRREDVHRGALGTRCGNCHGEGAWRGASFDHDAIAGAGSNCYGCHARRDVHRGQAGKRCGSCHATDRWRPSNFGHSFPLRGPHRRLTCGICHPRSWQTYTCYGCHKHERRKMVDRHLREGIANIDDCAHCHPTGK